MYGRAFLDNGFLAYEDGVPTTGATSPLWAMALAVIYALVPASAGVDGVVRGTAALGVLLHLGVIAVATDIAGRATRSAGAATAAGVLVALATPFAMAAFSGMEVGLAALMLSLGIRSLLRQSWGWAGAWLGLAGATRPESAAVILLGLAFVLHGEPASRRLAASLRYLAGPLLCGGAFLGYDLWASGAPLPAAFYAKSSGSLSALPGRLVRALTGIFPQVPPFAAGLGWIALLGLVPRISGPLPSHGSRAGLLLPALAGTVFVLANVVLIDPRDPAAFYHVRYLLPAIPLLLVGLVGGAWSLGLRFGFAPLVVLVVLSMAGAVRGVLPVSRHFHNDVRNINEVQRRIGEHLGETLPAGTRIATSDAGAIRYFSKLPTIDVTGLNTPEMQAPTETFVRENPVAAIALLPAWYKSPDADQLQETFRAITSDYTVTSDERMAGQLVFRLSPAANTSPTGGNTRIRFVGFHTFALEFLPTPSRQPGATDATRPGPHAP